MAKSLPERAAVRRRHRRVRRAVCALTSVVCVAGLAACSSSASSSSSSAASSGTGSATNGDIAVGKGTGTLHASGASNEIVVFDVFYKDVYNQTQYTEMQKYAATLGYKLHLIDSNGDEATQDQNVQQYLASGQKPAGFIISPVDANAASNDTRLLAKVAPVVQMTNLPLDQGSSAYAGIDQYTEGEEIGRIALMARAYAKSIGMKLHSPGGNLLILDYTQNNPSTVGRNDGFDEVTKSAPFNIVDNDYANVTDADTGYTAASTSIPKYLSKGIDFIWAWNLDAAVGAARAAEADGLKLGKTTILFAGDCSGSLTDIENNEVYGTVIQPPQVEGILALRSLAQIIATGKVKPGTTTVPLSTTLPPLTMTPPIQTQVESYAALIGAKDLSNEYWGFTYAQTCGD
jgi:ribose transport system substrate-binding protein